MKRIVQLFRFLAEYTQKLFCVNIDYWKNGIGHFAQRQENCTIHASTKK